MPVNVYEALLILDSNRYAREQAGATGQITDFVTKHGGEVLASRLWEERRLAYPINGQRKGTYWLCYFKLDSNQLATIKHDCKLSENILRSLILKVDHRIADALVEHALQGTHRAPAATTEAKPVAVVAAAETDEGQEEEDE